MDGSTSSAKMPTGVRVRSGSIEINFRWNGRREYVTLPLSATPANIKQAAKTRAEIVNKAKWGILTAEDLQLVAGKPVEQEDNRPTFQDYAQSYLDNCQGNIGTRQKYLSILERCWMPLFATHPIADITSQQVRQAVNQMEWSSAKTRNDSLIPLRGVFKLAFQDEVIDKDPCDRITNKKHQDPEPDPFTRHEMDLILRNLATNYTGDRAVYYWYFELAFWTGCRPSELIALTWQDVDFVNGSISINKGRVKGVQQNTTKTSQARVVYLNDRSRAALEALKLTSYLRYDHVLICPQTNRPWPTEKGFREIMVLAQKRTGVRHRPAYNTRHTYATMLLMDGANPTFVANQLGHSVLMLTKRYSKWVHGDQTKQELAKLNTGNQEWWQNGGNREAV